MPDNVLVLGATSGIAKAITHELARAGHRLILAGRDADQLQRLADDVKVRFSSTASTAVFDALDFDSHPAFIQRVISDFDGRLDCVVLCYGYMVDQPLTQEDFAQARRTIDVNYTSPVSILHLAAAQMEKQKSGCIAAISSVAGDRGRQSNYLYGSSKAALTSFLQGLRNRLTRSNVHVLTIKPGFVATAMTVGKINPNSPLVATPQKVARDIVRAIQKRKNVLYTPWFWWGIMSIICAIPEFIFKKLKL